MTSRDVSHDVIRSLAMEPRKDVRCWDHFYINNYNFHTYSYGKNKSTMNYGVSVKGVDGVEYYGILQEVIELLTWELANCTKQFSLNVIGLTLRIASACMNIINSWMSTTRKNIPSMICLFLHIK